MPTRDTEGWLYIYIYGGLYVCCYAVWNRRYFVKMFGRWKGEVSDKSFYSHVCKKGHLCLFFFANAKICIP